MLEVLYRIVEEVNAAPDLGEALGVIVRRVKQAVAVDVCSVYLTDFERREHVLRATNGLRQEAVGKVRLPFHRGLIGLVCERAEPINLDDAPSHPKYLFITESGEMPYHGFLGVPIIQNRQVLGVLVVRQRTPRKFGDNEVSFLFTLAAQLAGAIIHAQASGELTRLQSSVESPGRFLNGRPSSPGVAMGKLVVAYRLSDLNAVPDRKSDDPEKDVILFQDAVRRVKEDLKQLQSRMDQTLPAEERALFDALLLMLGGDSLVGQTIEKIREGEWVQAALHHTIEEHARVFDAMDDVYLRERASDIRDLGRRILMRLQTDTPPEMEYPDQTILVGGEVSAVDLVQVPKEKLVGVVSATGSSLSHVAILARGLGLPAVMGVTDLPVGRLDGWDAILDGYRGRIYVSPEPSVRMEYQRLVEEDLKLDRELEEMRGKPAETTDGTRIGLYLNTGLISEMGSLGVTESSGVGLYRTELPFMIRDRFPGEAAQVLNYRKVLETFAPRPVALRTLDIGGDKPLPYFPVSESNPFLGWRGIRISLDHPEIFLTQVRAMLLAASGLDNLHIMLPMITTLTEVDELIRLINQARDELLEEGHGISPPRIGVMVEVPAAVYQVEALARRVDFISVGTNDLTQYMLAVDRNNPWVADIYDDMHPSVLKALVHIVKEAHRVNRPVSICGEMAGNPLASILLLGMGVDSLSMSAGSLLRVKWVIRSISRKKARKLLKAALKVEDSRQVRQIMQKALEQMGLGRLVRLGR